jgi:hypothetical protein
MVQPSAVMAVQSCWGHSHVSSRVCATVVGPRTNAREILRLVFLEINSVFGSGLPVRRNCARALDCRSSTAQKGDSLAMDIMLGLDAKALEIAKQLKEVNKQLSEAEFKLKIAELYESLADVKMALADAKEELATKDKLDRYRLTDCGGQTFVYELKASEVTDESPQHRICAACYQQGKIGHLQFDFKDGAQDWYECSVCKDRRRYGLRR